MPMRAEAAVRLDRVLGGLPAGAVAVAVSGGVDSLTLATAVARRLGRGALMVHALSPAVPGEATARVRSEAARQDWRLGLIDAGEFADPAYRANPANRCFHCKANLYRAIAALGPALILSGTNRDDLEDVRPGLAAAARHGVRHPFVEAGLGKDAVRALAGALGLGAIAELPASPCLSSRIETGRWIEPAELALIERIEALARAALAVETVRCRVRAAGVVLEFAPFLPDDPAVATLRPVLEGEIASAGLALPLGIAPYRRGSAFLDGRAEQRH
jgi:uncharacterized protein